MTEKEKKQLAIGGLVVGATGMFFFPIITGSALLFWGGYEGYKAWKKKNN